MPNINDTFIRELWSKIKKNIPHKLNDLDEDCKISSPTENQILKYNGSRWVNSSPQSYSQQQTDWNNSDNTSVSYIKNKPSSLPASDVYSWAKAATKPTYTKSEVGLGNVDNVKQYSAFNPPPYPVTSVNAKTGDVTLTASDVGAFRRHDYASYLEFPTTPTHGTENDFFIDVGANATYRWDSANLHYYCIGRDYEEIDIISGGKS